MSTEQSNNMAYLKVTENAQSEALTGKDTAASNVVYYADAVVIQRRSEVSDPGIEDEEWIFSD